MQGKRIALRDSDLVGQGGEAMIYDLHNGLVAKIYKGPNHPDFASSPIDKENVRKRLLEIGTKLRTWPKLLPKEVIGPKDLITDQGGGKVLGYTMSYLKDTEVLLRLSEKDYQESHGITKDKTLEVMKYLHTLVDSTHRANAVIGDFNDLNVLVDQSMRPYLVDADSMQFGGFTSRLFTVRFVDPLLCETKSPDIILIKPHNTFSDWYAYSIMLMQILLHVHPYGGVHSPPSGQKKLRDWERMKQRVTIFDTHVKYPRPATPFCILPDELLDHFHKVFEKDERKGVEKKLIESIRFTACATCGTIHARGTCPNCMTVTKTMTKEIVRGSVSAMKILDTSGRIVYANTENGKPVYVYHEQGAYYREGKQKLIAGDYDPNLRVRIMGDATLFGKQGELVALSRSGNVVRTWMTSLFRGKVPSFDACASAVYMARGDTLYREENLKEEFSHQVATILPNQSLVWSGDHLGFLFMQAGDMIRAHIIRTQSKSLGEEVNLNIKGQLIDATVVTSLTNIWFFATTVWKGAELNTAFLFDSHGTLNGRHETTRGDESWLSRIRGKTAFRGQLFVPTDEGVVRVEATHGSLEVVKVFSDTSSIVDGASQLLLGNDGLYVVEHSRIWRLQMK